MDIWTIFEYFRTIHEFMNQRDQCLYNAIVLTWKNHTDERLIRVRESARELIAMIDHELADRASERRENDEEILVEASL